MRTLVEGIRDGQTRDWGSQLVTRRATTHQTWGSQFVTVYLSLPPTRHDLTQGQKPEGRLKWG